MNLVTFCVNSFRYNRRILREHVRVDVLALDDPYRANPGGF